MTDIAHSEPPSSVSNTRRNLSSPTSRVSDSTQASQGFELHEVSPSCASEYSPLRFSEWITTLPSDDTGYATVDPADSPRKAPVRRPWIYRLDLGPGTSTATATATTIDSQDTKVAKSTGRLPKSVRRAIRTTNRSAAAYPAHSRPDHELGEVEEGGFEKWSRSVKRVGRYLSVSRFHPSTIDYITKLKAMTTDEGSGDGKCQERLDSSTEATDRENLQQSAGTLLEWIATEENKQQEKRKSNDQAGSEIWYGHWNS